MKKTPDRLRSPSSHSREELDNLARETRATARDAIKLENTELLFEGIEVDAREGSRETQKLGEVWKVLSKPEYYKFRALITAGSILSSVICIGSVVNDRLHHQNTNATTALFALTIFAVQIANLLATQQAAKKARENLKKSALQ